MFAVLNLCSQQSDAQHPSRSVLESGAANDNEYLYLVPPVNAAGTLTHIDKTTDGETTDYVGGMARVTNNITTYLHKDHVGSAIAGTSQNGLISWREHPKSISSPLLSQVLTAQYAAHGHAFVRPLPNDDRDTYTGHIRDKATGLTYMQARYYQHKVNRFLSIDPIGFSVGNTGMFNRYSYVGNDPVNGTDPTGKFGIGLTDNDYAQINQGTTDWDGLQGTLDVAGFAPVVGIIPDLVNAGISAGRGNFGEAGINLVGAVPGAGDAFKAGKIAAKHGDEIVGGAKSAISRVNLQKQLASESQLSQLAEGGGTIISQPAKQAQRIASQNGLEAGNIQKVSSDTFKAADGTHIETHAFRDSATNTLIEPKTVIDP